MIRVSLVRMADARAQGMVAELLCVSGRRLLRAGILDPLPFDFGDFGLCSEGAILGQGPLSLLLAIR